MASYSLFFLIGSALASFIQVLTQKKFWQEKKWQRFSKCLTCHKRLFWWELIPVFSFLFLKGKCHHCHQKIPASHFFFEFLLGSCFVLFYHFGFSHFLFFWFTGSLFLSWEDLLTREIPFLFTILFHSLLLLGAFITQQPFFWLTFCYVFFLYLLSLLFLKEKMGFGDWLLLFFWSVLLPFTTFLWLILVSCLLALPFSLYHHKKPLPFIPFLTISLIFLQFF